MDEGRLELCVLCYLGVREEEGARLLDQYIIHFSYVKGGNDVLVFRVIGEGVKSKEGNHMKSLPITEGLWKRRIRLDQSDMDEKVDQY